MYVTLGIAILIVFIIIGVQLKLKVGTKFALILKKKMLWGSVFRG